MSHDYEFAKKNILCEGWGYLFFKYLDPTALLPVGVPLHGSIGKAVFEVISSNKLNKIVNNPIMKKYLSNTCDEILQKLKKDTGDKSWTAKMPSGFINAFKRMWHGSDELGFFHGSRWTNFRSTFWEDQYYHVNTTGYNITFFYDSDHIDAAIVTFYSPEKDQIIGKRIPEPSKQELKDLGFREEKL